MTGHDRLCPFADDDPPRRAPDGCDYCRSIAQVRADERERIAQAIEAAHKAAPDCGPCAYVDAARIARNGDDHV